jgi:hypothetical protein
LDIVVCLKHPSQFVDYPAKVNNRGREGNGTMKRHLRIEAYEKKIAQARKEFEL